MRKAAAQFSIDSWRIMFAACFLAGVGALAFNTLPLINGFWMERYDYSVEEVGAINGAQLAGFTLGIFTSPFWIRLLALRPIVITGLLGTTCVVVLPYLPSPKDWALIFVFLGFSNALILAPVVALLGKASHAERAYGFMYALQMLLAIIVTFTMTSSFFGVWGLNGALNMLATISFLGIGPALILPDTTIVNNLETKSLNWPMITLISIGLLFFMFGMVGIWSFLDKLESLKFELIKTTSMDSQSFLVSMSLLASLTGSFVAAWLDDRIGLFLPLLLGLLLILFGITSMALGAETYVFLSGALAASFGWNLILAYGTAELAYADRSGNLVALSPGIIGLGGAFGAVGLGSILASGDTTTFYIIAAVAVSFGIFCLILGANIKTRTKQPIKENEIIN